jgi:hypothetical protein
MPINRPVTCGRTRERNEAQEYRRSGRGLAALGLAPAAHRELDFLYRLRWEVSPRLHGSQLDRGQFARAKRFGKAVRGREGILDGQVHADAADRRHSMSGIANAQQTGLPPLFQPQILRRT